MIAAILALLVIQEDPVQAIAAAAAKVREKLAGVEGVRAVSYAGVDKDFRIIVSAESDAARDAVRKELGFEFEGVRVLVYTPAMRARVWAKPMEEAGGDAPAPPPKKDEKVPPAADRNVEDVPSVDDSAELRALEAKTYKSGVETISMIELLECDGIRSHFGLPAAKRKEKPCTLATRIGIGGPQARTSQRIINHRKACPFSSEKLLYYLPAEARADLQKYAKEVRELEDKKEK